MALSFDINSNTRAAQKQVKELGKSLQDVADDVDDLGKNRSSEKLESNLRDLAAESKDTARVIRRELPDAYRDAERAADDFNRSATDNVQNFKSEAVQNFSEVASSFDGSVTSMADGVQGLTGGLASALTPGIGIPVAILGAAAGAFLQSWITSAEDSETRVSEMFDRLNEYGAAYISKSNIAEALGNLSQEDIVKGAERARDLNLEQSTVLRAMVGDTGAIADLYSVLADRKQREVDAIRDSGASLEDQATKVEAVNTKYGESTDWLRQIQDDTGTAADAWTAVQEAIRIATGDVAGLDSGLRGLPNPNVIVKINADDSGFRSAFATLQARAEQGITVNVRPGQGRFWE